MARSFGGGGPSDVRVPQSDCSTSGFTSTIKLHLAKVADSLSTNFPYWLLLALSLSSMAILPFALLPITLLASWLVFTDLEFPMLRDKSILLLIAHPDDEAMFFSPAVQSLTDRSLNNHLQILCLSTGDADGLGSIRKDELVQSALTLGLRSASDVQVLDDPRFPDSMTASWPAEDIAGVLVEKFAPYTTESTPSIDVLLTFDEGGVSGHPNHISLYHGARAFVGKLTRGRSGTDDPVKLYTLSSVALPRKYASIVDVPVTIVERIFSNTTTGEYPDPLVFVSGPKAYRKAQKAMTDAHVSQMRWFRWGWIGVSRYMVINDLRRERVA